MPKINLLDKHVAELIAAGEVAERPSSVIKELCENSIDAGATTIDVEIKNGGISYISITDNGCGIAHDDVKTAFLRHATSKVVTEKDLEAICTLGFRGEALPSIAAVSKVDILTRTADEEVGTLYKTEGCEEILFEEAGCPVGTVITVRDLFYNTPARMKFLKKDVSEGNAVADVIDRLALSHPEISFSLKREGKETLSTPGDGKLFSAIRAVYGKEFSSNIIPVEYESNGMSIFGYISKPVNSRASRSMQNFFVNGRFVKTNTGSAALSEAYKNSIMVGKYPACVLSIILPPGTVDANVHPAKTEIRFTDEKSVFSLVYYAVKNALITMDTRPERSIAASSPKPFTIENRYEKKEIVSQMQIKEEAPIVKHNTGLKNVLPSAPFDNTMDIFVEDVVEEKVNAIPKMEENNFKSFNNVNIDIFVDDELDKAEKQEKFVDDSKQSNIKESVPEVEDEISENIQETKKESSFKLIGEAFGTYVFVEIDNKIMVIDKHAAHERILYNKLCEADPDTSSQQMLTPVIVRLSKKLYDTIINSLETLNSAGFDIDDYGDGDVIVRGVPLLCESDDIIPLVEEIAENLAENKSAVTEHMQWIYHSVACRAAVKAGDRLENEELIYLAKQIVSDESVKYCPHGRPVAFFITKNEIEKNFGRI